LERLFSFIVLDGLGNTAFVMELSVQHIKTREISSRRRFMLSLGFNGVMRCILFKGFYLP
jgi:hypothetical protein